MNYDPQLHRKVMLAQYIRLGALPSWKEYVWKRVNELARLDPTLYGDVPEIVTQALRPASAAQSSQPSSSLTTNSAIPTTARG